MNLNGHNVGSIDYCCCCCYCRLLFWQNEIKKWCVPNVTQQNTSWWSFVVMRKNIYICRISIEWSRKNICNTLIWWEDDDDDENDDMTQFFSSFVSLSRYRRTCDIFGLSDAVIIIIIVIMIITSNDNATDYSLVFCGIVLSYFIITCGASFLQSDEDREVGGRSELWILAKLSFRWGIDQQWLVKSICAQLTQGRCDITENFALETWVWWYLDLYYRFNNFRWKSTPGRSGVFFLLVFFCCINHYFDRLVEKYEFCFLVLIDYLFTAKLFITPFICTLYS